MRIDKNTTIKLGDKNIVKIKIGDSVIWEKKTEPEIDYFYIENVDTSDGEIIFTTKKGGTPTVGTYTEKIEYSSDKTNWNTINFNTSTPQTVIIKSGEKVYLRNDSGEFNYYDYNKNYSTTITTTQKYVVGGNINTLLNYNEEIVDISGKDGCFYELFKNSKITDASHLILPSTTLASSCYREMFYGCKELVNATSLPATTLASSCYQEMFYGCTSLVSAPELPATTLTSSCYYSMFIGCKSLVSAPELPATTLASSCYESMFQGCTGLTTAPELPATKLAEQCYAYMFAYCASLVNAPELPATTLEGRCYYYMFRDCSKLTTAPTELPATKLFYECYREMFSGCKALVNAPIIYATTLARYCCTGMFNGCTSLVTASALPATKLADDCYYDMFSGCSKLTTAPTELPATKLFYECYRGMFSGCKALTTAPTLPATTLATSCYSRMFSGCTSLNEVTVYAEDISASGCTDYWLSNVASSGTFNNIGFAPFETDSVNGIPTGWTEVKPSIESITANPDTFTIKSYKDTVKCTSTLTITTTSGIILTKTNSATITVGENTGDTTRTIVETIPYKDSSYQVTIVQTANDVKPPMSWNVVSEGRYPFQLNTNNYYESTNKGKGNSYSYATLNYSGFENLVLECINSGESNYDYGIISQPDVELSKSTTDDGATGSTKVFKNFKGQSSTNPVQIVIPSDEGSHFITIKFRKDSSGDSNNDSLQFRVIEPTT